MRIDDNIVISGRIIGIDPVTKNCWIALKNINSNSTQQHDLTIALPQQYLKHKEEFYKDKTINTIRTTSNKINEIKSQEIKCNKDDNKEINKPYINNINYQPCVSSYESDAYLISR